MTCQMDRRIQRLLHPKHLYTASEVLRRPCPVPKSLVENETLLDRLLHRVAVERPVLGSTALQIRLAKDL